MTTEQTSIADKLKSKWDLKNNIELAFVFVVFLATGISSFFLATKPILKSFGLQDILPEPLFLLLSAIATIPILLIVVLFLNYNRKLKERWLLKSNWQFFLIIVLFSITGSTSVRLARPILDFLNIHNTMAWYIYWPLRILIVFPAYQLLFMIFGTLLGQWEFAWRFEKKMMGGFGRLFGIKPKKEEQN